MTKLTLSVDEAVVERAKQVADAGGTSVSAMFSQFVRSMATPSRRPSRIGPLTRKVSGIVKLPPGKNDKELLTAALMEKHRIKK